MNASRSILKEVELLLACAAIEPDAPILREMAFKKPDWEKLIDLSVFHSTLPIVRNIVKEQCRNFIPEKSWARMDELYYEIIARSTHLTEELFRVLEHLPEGDFRVIPYKGPVIASRYYDNPAGRRFDDLDFLVPGGDLHRIKDTLVAAGYTPLHDLTPAQQSAHFKAGWELILKEPKESYSIEFDTGVAPAYFSFEVPFDEMWEKRGEVLIDGRPVPSLGKEHLLLLLCAHGTKHLWERIIWISDIAHILEKEKIDWDLLTGMATEQGALRMLYLGLAMADGLMSAPFPKEIEEAVAKDETVIDLASKCLQDILSGKMHEHTQREEIAFHLRARERSSDRTKYKLRLALTPSYADWTSLPLPEPLFPLYYVTRPFRLLTRLVRGTRVEQDDE